MKKSIKKLIAIGIIASSICMLPITGVSASWKQNSDNTWSYDNVTNGWFKDNSNWYFFKDGTMQTGWIKDNSGKYYYLSSNGSMLSNTTTPDGYKVGNDGSYIVNTTVNSNNVSNSNNTTNTSLSNTNNIDNSKTLNNTGSINNGVINNGVISNTTNNTNVNITKKTEKKKEANDDKSKAYYELKLKESKESLKQAETDLERAKSQKTVKNYEKQSDGTYQNVYSTDKSKIESAEHRVNTYKDLVDYYSKSV